MAKRRVSRIARINATLDRFARLIELNARQLRKDKAEAKRQRDKDRAEDAKRRAEDQARWERKMAEWEHQREIDKAEAKRWADEAKAEAKRWADEAKAEAKRRADEAKAEAKRRADEEKRRADEAKAEAKRRADEAKAEAKRRADEAKAEAKRRADEEKRRADEEKRRAAEEKVKAEAEAKRQIEREKSLKKMEDSVSNLGNHVRGMGISIGDITEAITVSEKIIKLVNKFAGIKVDSFDANLERTYMVDPDGELAGDNRKQYEIDGLVVGENAVMIIEAKTKLNKGDIISFIKRLPRFKQVFREHADRDVYAGVAFIRANDKTLAYAEKLGLFIIKTNPPDVVSVNSENFKPSKFA